MLEKDFNFVKSCLIKTGYADNSVTEATAHRLLSLNGDAAKMLENWLKTGEQPSFKPINDVDSNFLVDKLKMKVPALIIAYAMLIDSPKENADYFKTLANNIIGFYPNLN